MTFITSADRQRFNEDGYLLVTGLLDPENDLDPLIMEYAEVLEAAAKDLFVRGKITSLYNDLPFGQRAARIIEESDGELHKYFDISLPQKGVTEETPMHCGPAIFALLRNERLLDTVESFLGPKIISNPTQHVRVKPPATRLDGHPTIIAEMATTVWHQDQGTVSPDADETDMLTVWIAVTEATRHNGCLLVAPGSHKRGLAAHCHDHRANYSRQAIPEHLVGNRRVALEARPGDVVFLNKLTMHASLPNLSDDIRWSLDLRYNPTGQATGRSWFPSFIARDRAAPENELRDPRIWAELWQDARRRLIDNPPTSFQRWSKDDPGCA
jgi:ectoine hydroxylase-related dioxygenase (phytanoyl-CoA dioxygenase family)